MRVIRSVMVLGSILLSAAGATAQVEMKGNDTGGIISWTPEAELIARDWTAAYCARYGKFARITSVNRQYGDYIGFNCLWRPDIARYALPEVPVASDGCRVIRARVHGHWQNLQICD